MVRLGENRYGKARVRLSRITRTADRHDFNEWTVRVMLQGDFESSFAAADNSNILPTDTMKNTVYSIARSSDAATIEEFAMELGDYLLSNNPQVAKASVEIDEKCWERLAISGEPEATTFKMAGPELQTVTAEHERGGGWVITSGVDGLMILKTTKSAFTGYITDRLTTLKPATDRIFGTRATIKWDYVSAVQKFSEVRARITTALLKEFAAHLSMPNLHHLLADLSSFGQDNPNHIFVPIDEPHGYIEATIER
jgi:urate oxidase